MQKDRMTPRSDQEMQQATTLSSLSSNEIALETHPEAFSTLRDSSSIAADPVALRRRMEVDGYLFLRGLLDRDSVLAARQEILLKFAIVGEIDSINHPVMDGIQSTESFINKVNLVAFTESLRSGLAYGQVVAGPDIMRFFDRFLGGKARSFDFRWPRFMRPGEATGVHCDAPYITRGTTNLWSAWIPLGDISMQEGALMILSGSHKNEQLRLSYGMRDADHDKIGWLSTNPAELRRRLGGRWLSTDFRAGDVLVFGPYLVHASLDNNSAERRCRLSSDTRYLLAGDALDERWNGDISNPHGGGPKVFLPGGRRKNNEGFQEEWKPIDDKGRLLT
jgi:ectoine hydroxylase-related dioxygenase (phytanoyl-CoA dioxygenase family)